MLPLACGRATRLVRFLTASDKEYEATIRFGVTTDTLRHHRRRKRAAPARRRRATRSSTALRRFDGEQLQMPPAYSAKKVGGRRAYELARRDEPVELDAGAGARRRELELLDVRRRPRAASSLTCSAGFYVRSLAHDLGERCGTGACLEALRRTRSGEFTLDEADRRSTPCTAATPDRRAPAIADARIAAWTAPDSDGTAAARLARGHRDAEGLHRGSRTASSVRPVDLAARERLVRRRGMGPAARRERRAGGAGDAAGGLRDFCTRRLS